MLTRHNSVVMLAPTVDACALWRLFMTHMSMPGSSFFCFMQTPRYELVAGNDVCVLQRCHTDGQYKFMAILADMGMKLVYDLDDNMWQIPRSNPAYRMLTPYREGFGHCIRMVDVLSVSTKTLANAVKQHVKDLRNVRTGKLIPVIVAENRLYEPMFVAPRRSEKTIVGWAGSTSHIGDLPLINKAVKTCSAEFPGVTFQFRGHAPADEIRALPNYEFQPWMPVSQFCGRMPLWGWTVGLAPVTDEPFNASKSCIKMIESAWCGIPTLASNVRPYWEFCSHHKDLGWLLCTTEDQWTKKLRELLADPGRRESLGQLSKNVALEHYSFRGGHAGWEAVWEAARG